MANMITRNNAEALIPTEESKEIMAAVTQSSAALSRMRRLRNMTSKQTKLAVLDGLPVAGFVSGDTGLKPTSGADWKNKYITAEEIAVIIPIPEAVLDDAEYDIWSELKPSIIEAFGVVIDKAVFFSVDKPNTWPDGIVTAAISKSKTVELGSSGDIADDINNLMALVELDGFDVNGFVGDVGIKSALRGLRDKNGGLIFQPSLQAETPGTIYAQPVNYLKNGAWDSTAAKLLAGDWNQAVYAIRQDITYKVLDQAVISDTDGKIIYNFAQQDMVGLRCVMRLGWQLPNPATRLGGENRYPFSALVPKTVSQGDD